jgi:predicted PurR-regulated permease PerM
MTPGKPQLVVGAQAREPAPLPEQPTPAASEADAAARIARDTGPAGQKTPYVVLLVLTVGALYVAYIVFRPFLTALFLALVLAIAAMPVYQWIAVRVRGRSAAAFLTTAAVVLLIMVPLMLISLKLVSEAASFYSSVSQQGFGALAGRSDWLSEAIQRTSDHIGMAPQQVKSMLAARVQGFAAWMVGMAGWAARGFVQQVINGIITFLILFFFLRDHDQYMRAAASMLPLPPGRAQQLGTTVQQTVIANIYGMFAVGILQGSLTAVGFWMTGLRAPLLWGAMATILSFVPLVGPSLVWIPGVVVLALQGSWTQAIILGLWGSIAISAADYIVRPRVAGGRVNANRLLVLLSFLGGLSAFGAIGIIAGPVVLSLVMALLSMVREERASLRENASVREKEEPAA